MSCTMLSTSGRVKDQREPKHSTHDETRFGPREPFRWSLGPGAQSRGGAIGAPLAVARDPEAGRFRILSSAFTVAARDDPSRLRAVR
jgi:hypothetical protein